MKVISSTDGKYIGKEVEGELDIGSVIVFGDFSFEVYFRKELEDGHITVGSPNYQIALEV